MPQEENQDGGLLSRQRLLVAAPTESRGCDDPSCCAVREPESKRAKVAQAARALARAVRAAIRVLGAQVGRAGVRGLAAALRWFTRMCQLAPSMPARWSATAR